MNNNNNNNNNYNAKVRSHCGKRIWHSLSSNQEWKRSHGEMYPIICEREYIIFTIL